VNGAVDIVIVNWNSGGMLAEAIASIETFGQNIQTVTVVDNGSVDKSASVSSASVPLKVILTGKNEGFARGCNIGAEHGDAEYILFLNPDAQLVSDGLNRAVDFLSGEGILYGICGVKLTGRDLIVQRHCANFTTPGTYFGQATGLSKLFPNLFKRHFMTEFDHLTSRSVDQVIGAYFLTRRSLFEKLNGFDEQFFVYYEEVDFALRAKEIGCNTYYLAEADGFHYGGGTTDQVKAARLFYSLRSRILYSFKHFSWFGSWIVVAVTLVIEPIARSIRAVVRGSFRELLDTLRGFKMLWADMPNIIRTARARPPKIQGNKP
jgi:N-acetylglucosaminyl-diphospho-decaprenol L-rhamnosyltransferase